MSKKKRRRKGGPPCMPFWVQDFLGSSTVQEMSGEEAAAYSLALIHLWNLGANGLPANEEKLRELLRVSRRFFVKVRPALYSAFRHENDRLFHSKVDELLSQVEKRSESAKRAAETRWGNTDTERISESDLNASQTQCNPSGLGLGSSSFSSSQENIASEKSALISQPGNVAAAAERVVAYYLEKINPRDDTRTHALQAVIFALQDEQWTEDDLNVAIDRYALESGDTAPKYRKRCKTFFSQGIFEGFLREGWQPPARPKTSFTEEELREMDRKRGFDV